MSLSNSIYYSAILSTVSAQKTATKTFQLNPLLLEACMQTLERGCIDYNLISKHLKLILVASGHQRLTRIGNLNPLLNRMFPFAQLALRGLPFLLSINNSNYERNKVLETYVKVGLKI